MKNILFILFLFAQILKAETYYVSPYTGNNADAGTDTASAWASWIYAFQHADVGTGDTVLFRGGVYYAPSTNGSGAPGYSRGIYVNAKNGTRTAPICFFNYPGEVPIWDCKNVTTGYQFNTSNFYALLLNDCSWIKLKGLTIRNMWGNSLPDDGTYGFNIFGGHNITLENCVCYNTRNWGFDVAYNDSIFFINCDSYNHCDSFNTQLPGNDGYGFTSYDADYPGQTIYTTNLFFIGCRAWNNGDDGFAIANCGLATIDSCWSFNNGILYGEGNGFKLGWIENYGVNYALNRKLTHSLSVYNRAYGIRTNEDVSSTYTGSMQVYNNTSYHNGYYPTEAPGAAAYGFFIHQGFDPIGAHALARVFRNNLSYDNEDGEILVGSGALYTHSNNSWDSQVTLSDADFVSLDSATAIAIMKGPRQSGGWLPSLGNFLKLASTSDLIDKGTNVSLPYEGSAPDLGADEYKLPSDVSAPQISTNALTYTTYLAVGTGGHTIYDGGGTISAKGICWATHTTPDLTDNVVVCGTGTADFTTTVTGLPANTIIYIRAYATNETGTGYGLTEVVRTHASDFVKNGGQFIKHNGVLIKIQ
jgi:hypothetical protein